MPTVTVIATGGTIVSARDENGAAVPQHSAEAMLERLRHEEPGSPTHNSGRLEVNIVELMAKDSSAMTFADMDRVSDAVARALQDPATDAVVVLHGTDTMEETAMAVDLWTTDPRPVVFTGAQRSFDHADSDGPTNLAAAIGAALHPAHRGAGVLIAFGGVVLAARGCRKVHTTDLDAYGPVRPLAADARHVPLAQASLAPIRVDTVVLYPGADRVQIDACVRAGARGIVLEAMGSGNANVSVVGAVRDAVAAGVVVVVTTRVAFGSAAPVYGGGGGGYDLAQAGAVFSTNLRSSQARVLLAHLIALGATPAQREAQFDMTHPAALR